MTYPIAPPELKIAWDSEITFESSAISQRFDGGADFRETRSQLNQMLRSRTVNATLNYTEYLVVETFFATNIGKPFNYDEALYICESYTWTILDYQGSISRDGVLIKPTSGLFKLDASLQEVIRV